jgi:hypothetical protein
MDNGLGVCICNPGYFRFNQNNGTCFKVDVSMLPSCYG